MENKNRCLRFLTGICMFILMPSCWAMQGSLDASFASSTQADDWGLAAHYQLIGSDGLGLDLGYQYLSGITYEALNEEISHSMSQAEAGFVWQAGDQGLRFQALAGGVFSATKADLAGNEIISVYQPGYQLGVGFSAPVFSRFRAFFDVGYQGWFGAEIPNHMRWRYGLRMMLGPDEGDKLESVERQQAAQAAAMKQSALLDPPTTINANVPEYIPVNMSQSLPPIIANAELCKCFPAGPYTLQLGQFSNMNQAIRGLDYRGLRQFFNSRAYQKVPLPVFLAQPDGVGPVSLYMGELNGLDELAYWQHELKKSGLDARLQRVIGANGQRVNNPMVTVDESELDSGPKYTAEDIRRMNSLPEEDMEPTAVVSVVQSEDQLIEEKQAMEQKLTMQRQELNQVEAKASVLSDVVLQIGPLPLTRLEEALASPGFKKVLSRDNSVMIPNHLLLTWDEGKQEAWLSFDEFASNQQVDEWQAWFDSEGLVATKVTNAYVPMGDVYQFLLAEPLQEYSLEIDRNESISVMMQRLRSPEVLWFHAYQRINEQPVETSLNWSVADNRFHLIVVNVKNRQEQQSLWSNLTAVGLLPSLAEQ